jgi:GntR family transcriptional regulator, transcriptional repressor for pyruvate dehydrogenase complex
LAKYVDAERPIFAQVRQRRAFEEIILQIEEAIIEGRLSAGDRLPPERELAQIFAVSRPAVREAMRVLEAFGVITARRGSGSESGSTLVSGEETNGLGGLLRVYSALLRIPLSDLIVVRVALEATAIRAIVAKASDDDFHKLDAIVDEMRVANTPERFLETDTAFHLMLAELSGNSALTLLMGELREAVAREMLSAFQRLEDFEPERQWLVGEHARLVAVIRSKDEQVAVQAISDHIHGFYNRVLQEDGPTPPTGRRRQKGTGRRRSRTRPSGSSR